MATVNEGIAHRFSCEGVTFELSGKPERLDWDREVRLGRVENAACHYSGEGFQILLPLAIQEHSNVENRIKAKRETNKKQKGSEADTSTSPPRSEKRSSHLFANMWTGLKFSRKTRDDEGIAYAIKQLAHEVKRSKRVTEQQLQVERQADKMRRIEFALQNIRLATHQKRGVGDSFDTLEPGPREELVRKILLSFRQGKGHQVDCFTYINENNLRIGEAEEADFFQTEITKVLHPLLGKEPRFEHNVVGGWTIHYK